MLRILTPIALAVLVFSLGTQARAEEEGGKRKRAALFFELEPGIAGDQFLQNPNPAIAFGIDYNGRADRLVRHHLRLGYKRMNIGNGLPTLQGLTFSPALLGVGIPIVESDGFRLEIEIQANIFKLDFLKVSRGGSDLLQVDFSFGLGTQIQAVFGDTFFLALQPVMLDFQYAIAAAGDGIFTTFRSGDGLAINFPVGIAFGLEY